jgi:selenocysteine lyase/cysteine desulfurase
MVVKTPSMTMQRREFLTGAGAVLGAVTTARAATTPAGATPKPGATADLSTWAAVRDQFLLDRDHIHMAMLLFASHPTPVREAIERHRRGFDLNPVTYFHENVERCETEARAAAAAYVGAAPEEVALTGNTTTGLAVVYGGLPLKKGQEIVTTTHDHYATHEALRQRAVHTGAAVRKVPLYATPAKASEDEIVGNLVKAVGPRTRAVAVTWVHSSTGVKLPIRKMSDALADVNKRRRADDRVLLCVDGVHAFGVEKETAADLGCDFLVAGCHKWIFGPRGTGMVWGRPDAWKGNAGIIPCFEWAALQAWMRGEPPDAVPPGPRTSPGGFQSFEHRWALPEAFRFHERLGRARVTARIHELAAQCKDGLAKLPKVKLHTPRAEALSAGLVCFEVDGLPPKEVVKRLAARKIVASDTPYAPSYARLTPSLLNTPEEVDRTVAEVAAL